MTWQSYGFGKIDGQLQQIQQMQQSQAKAAWVAYGEGAMIKLPLKAAEALNKMKAAAAAYRDLAIAAEHQSLADSQLAAQIEDEIRKGRDCDLAKVGLLAYDRHKLETSYKPYDKKNQAAATYWAAMNHFQEALLEAGMLPKLEEK